MPTLLHLDSSADLEGSVSRVLTRRFCQGWSAVGPDHQVVHRDLHTDPLPHLPTHALHWAPRLRTADETVTDDAQQLQDTLIAEVDTADVVVIGAPLYNWSIPSTLKAWIDYLHVPGTTTTSTSRRSRSPGNRWSSCPAVEPATPRDPATRRPITRSPRCGRFSAPHWA